MCVVIQNLMFDGCEGKLTEVEGRPVERLGSAWGAAVIPPGAWEHLAPALILLSPVESQRLRPVDSAFSSPKKKDGHPQKDRKTLDHLDAYVILMGWGVKRVPLTDMSGNNDSLLLHSKDKCGWEVLREVINIKKCSRCFCPHPGACNCGEDLLFKKRVLEFRLLAICSVSTNKSGIR